MSDPGFWFWTWYYFVISFSGLVIFLYMFGEKIERLHNKLEAEKQRLDKDGLGRAERNRAYIERLNREADERDRVRRLANQEMERLWSLKQRR